MVLENNEEDSAASDSDYDTDLETEGKKVK